MEKVSGRKSEKNCRVLEIIFLGCFVTGIVAANLYGRNRLQQYGVINDYLIQQLKYAAFDKTDYFIYLLKLRLPVLLALIFFGMTPWHRMVNGIFLIWSGFAIGFLCVMAISNIGAGAVLFLVMAMFPQFVFYILGYLLLLKIEGRYQRGNVSGKLGEWLLLWGIIILLFFLGFLTEAYMNPDVLHFVLKRI